MGIVVWVPQGMVSPHLITKVLVNITSCPHFCERNRLLTHHDNGNQYVQMKLNKFADFASNNFGSDVKYNGNIPSNFFKISEKFCSLDTSKKLE